MNRLSAAILLLFVATAGHAQEASAPAAVQAVSGGPIVVEGQTPGTEEKKVCRREASTGSIRTRRVCRTESEIAREAAQGERTLDTARRQRESQNLSASRRGG